MPKQVANHHILRAHDSKLSQQSNEVIQLKAYPQKFVAITRVDKQKPTRGMTRGFKQPVEFPNPRLEAPQNHKRSPVKKVKQSKVARSQVVLGRVIDIDSDTFTMETSDRIAGISPDLQALQTQGDLLLVELPNGLLSPEDQNRLQPNHTVGWEVADLVQGGQTQYAEIMTDARMMPSTDPALLEFLQSPAARVKLGE